jgi:hypothetical protein
MADQPTDAEAKLQKLGERVRAGHAQRHPMGEKSLATVRSAVREAWEQEQSAKKAVAPPTTTEERKRDGPKR